MNKKNNPGLTANAQTLRNNMTPQERHLWHDYLKLLPLTVNRQKVIGKYIADFYCAAAKIVIEVDGSQHFQDEGVRKDAERDAYFGNMGIKVLRYSNQEINTNFKGVCQDIENQIAASGILLETTRKTPHPSPAATPSPQGEGSVYADIVVNITNGKLDRSFQYRVPETLRDKVKEGSRVRVPFGNGSRFIDGYVIGLGSEPKIDAERIKDIDSVYEMSVTVEERLVKLAAWMRNRYGSTMIQALKTVLPVKEKMKVRENRRLCLAIPEEEAGKMAETFAAKHYTAKHRLLEALILGGSVSWEEAVRELKVPAAMIGRFEDEGIVEIQRSAAYRKPHAVPETGGERAGNTSDTRSGERAGNTLDPRSGERAGNTLDPRSGERAGNTLGPRSGERTGNTVDPRSGEHMGPLKEYPAAGLTDEQQACIEGILEEWAEPHSRPCLIHGVTGSGKTVVYMELIERVLAEGRQVILLIPEIALTWQNFERFYRRFGDAAALLNSRMSAGERSDLLERVAKKEVSLVIGPRSALFTPFEDLGLIIIDEEHEDSYKSEITPRYHARETAIERAHIENAFVVMGSATPSLEASYACETGRFRLLKMHKRYADAPLPEIETVDMRQELKNGNRSIVSGALFTAIREALDKKEQIMLFLNRRGYSGNFTCRSCGEVIKCPHCDVALTLHTDGFLVCHYCGHRVPRQKNCPSCGSPYIGGTSIGTQQAEEQLRLLFPDAAILRMDRDTTGGRYGHERILKSFRDHEADILLGTQMIAKGHDFPNVTLVGILSADISLYAADYRSGEKTYELLTQASGRAGRGSVPGRALIQTYHPEHYVFDAVMKQDYDAFYREEAANRRLLSYPPVGHILGIHASCADEQRLQTAMKNIRIFLERSENDGDTVILGPGPDEIYKIQDTFRMVLYIKAPDPKALIRLRMLTERYIEINRGFEPVAVQFDLDA